MIKKFFFKFLRLYRLLHLPVFCFSLILLFLKLKKKDIIFIQEEGGFGHMIVTSHVLNCVCKNKDWSLIWFYQKKRHNKYYNNFFVKNLFFITVPNSLFLRNIYLHISYLLSKFFLKHKIINYKYYLYKNYETSSKNLFYKKKMDSRFIKIISDNWKVGYRKYEDDFIKRFNLIKKSFKGIVSIHVRNKGTNSNSFSNYFRDTVDINNYKMLIDKLIKEGWQVFLSGDDFEPLEWMKNHEKELIFRSRTELDFNKYNFYCTNISDVMITNSCGNVTTNVLNKNKVLLLNEAQFGYGWPNSIVSYKFIKFSSKQQIKNLFYNFPSTFDQKYLKGLCFRDLNEKEILNVGMEFINNFNNPDYGVDPSILDLNFDFLLDSKAKISNEWLRIINYENLE
jgi:hypothetical protein